MLVMRCVELIISLILLIFGIIAVLSENVSYNTTDLKGIHFGFLNEINLALPVVHTDCFLHFLLRALIGIKVSQI